MGIRVEGRVIEIWGAGSSPLEPTYSKALIELPISGEDIREAVARAYNVSVGELPALEQSVCEAVISLLTEGKGESSNSKTNGDIECQFKSDFPRKEHPEKSCEIPLIEVCRDNKEHFWVKGDSGENNIRCVKCGDVKPEPKEKKAGLKCRDCSHYVDDLNCNIDVCIGFENFKPKQPKESIDWSEIECYVMENPKPNDTINCLQSYLSKRHNKLVEIVKELWRRNK